jgi:arylsulfatase A-like enzyme
VFGSDHGDMLFSQSHGWKCKPWRESIGVPLIVRWPGRVPAGRVTGGPISIVDHAPTLLALADAPPLAGAEGVDVSAFVLGDESAAPDSVFLSFPVIPAGYSNGAWRGVVTRTHTYARCRDHEWILYDDAADPFQLNNLIGSPEHEPLRQAMAAKLQDWLDRLGDAFEPARTVADRCYRGHVNMEMPYYENDTILEGRRARPRPTT